MGNATSASAAGENAGEFAGDEGLQNCGYRVLGVQAGSPAAAAGLVSFFDFIVMANHLPLRQVDYTFIDLIREFEDRPLELKIYNSKSQTVRDLVLTPSKNWDGQGMLGVTIRFDYYDQSEEHLVRVLEVVPDSPAELAGLQPMTDFLLGTAETVFKDPDVLEEVLGRNLEQTIDFYVYNTETDTVRTATLMPNLKWGGRGCLGAEIGHGYLHGLPQKSCRSNGTSVFKVPAPHIADATRASEAVGDMADEATGGGTDGGDRDGMHAWEQGECRLAGGAGGGEGRKGLVGREGGQDSDAGAVKVVEVDLQEIRHGSAPPAHFLQPPASEHEG